MNLYEELGIVQFQLEMLELKKEQLLKSIEISTAANAIKSQQEKEDEPV